MRTIVFTAPLVLLSACGGQVAAASDAGAASDASDGAAVDAAPKPTHACNDVENVGPLVAFQRIATNEPGFVSGSAPTPGLYVLDSETSFTGPGGASGPDGRTARITIRVQDDGKTWQVVSRSNEGPDEGQTYEIGKGTSEFTLTRTCPPPTGTSVVIFTAVQGADFSVGGAGIQTFRRVSK